MNASTVCTDVQALKKSRKKLSGPPNDQKIPNSLGRSTRSHIEGSKRLRHNTDMSDARTHMQNIRIDAEVEDISITPNKQDCLTHQLVQIYGAQASDGLRDSIMDASTVRTEMSSDENDLKTAENLGRIIRKRRIRQKMHNSLVGHEIE